MSLPVEQELHAQVEELCTLLRQNDSSVTRVEPLEDIGGYGYQLGEALLQNTVVTYLRLDVRKIVPYHETSLESATPLLRYLQTSTSLKEVKLESYSSRSLSQQLGHEILQAIASNSSIVSLDALECIYMSPGSLALLLTTTTSITTLTFAAVFSVSNMPMLHQLATAVGANHMIQDLTIFRLCVDGISNVALEDEPILLQLATHPTLQRLCLAMDADFSSPSLMHVEAVASLLLSTQTLQNLELRGYEFDRQSLLPILDALKENSTVTNLCLRSCSMNEEATEDFVEFVQHHCNTGTSKLCSLALCTASNWETFAGISVGRMAATMLIDSSLQSLHLCYNVGNLRAIEGFAIDMIAFFISLSENVDQIRLSSLAVDELSMAGVNALLEYLPKTAHLRNLTVSRMDRNGDSANVVAALRRNGSLYSVDMTKESAVNDEVLEPFFTTNEFGRVQAYCLRNQNMRILLAGQQRSRSRSPSNDTPTVGASHNLHVYTSLFLATRPTVRTAPNSLVMGLLSGNEDVGW